MNEREMDALVIGIGLGIGITCLIFFILSTMYMPQKNGSMEGLDDRIFFDNCSCEYSLMAQFFYDKIGGLDGNEYLQWRKQYLSNTTNGIFVCGQKSSSR